MVRNLSQELWKLTYTKDMVELINTIVIVFYFFVIAIVTSIATSLPTESLEMAQYKQARAIGSLQKCE